MTIPDVTWPQVAMALIAGAPGIVAAFSACHAAKTGRANAAVLADVQPAVTAVQEALVDSKARVSEVHTLVNSRMTEIQQKLEAALQEIGELKGEAPNTVAQAPLSPPPTFKDSA